MNNGGPSASPVLTLHRLLWALQDYTLRPANVLLCQAATDAEPQLIRPEP